MTELSQSDYATARGWSAAYVTKLKRQGRLVITPAGKVNVEATDRLIDSTRDPARGGDRRLQADADAGDAPAGAPMSMQAAKPGDFQSYKEAARRERMAKARIAELELAEKAGELVRRDEVEAAIFGLSRQAMDALDAIADRLSTQLAAEADPARVHTMLTTELQRVIQQLAKATPAQPGALDAVQVAA